MEDRVFAIVCWRPKLRWVACIAGWVFEVMVLFMEFSWVCDLLVFWNA